MMACYLGMLPYSEMKPAFVMVVCYLTVNGACLKSWWYGTMVSYLTLNKGKVKYCSAIYVTLQ